MSVCAAAGFVIALLVAGCSHVQAYTRPDQRELALKLVRNEAAMIFFGYTVCKIECATVVDSGAASSKTNARLHASSFCMHGVLQANLLL